jgi:hypothetical protein
MMDKELEQYFENYYDLFASKGWKQFIEDIEGNRTLMSDITSIKDANDLYYRKGCLDILDRVLNLQTGIENAHKEALDNEENV